MSKISFKPADTGTATFMLEAPATNTNRTITLPDEAGDLLVSPSANTSSDNAVTHKIPVVVDGVTYYLLATTDSA